MNKKEKGDGRRVHRIESEIQEVLGMYLIHGFSQPLDFFVSVTKVLVTADLRSAKVFVTMMSKTEEKNFRHREFGDKNQGNVESGQPQELSSEEETVGLLNEYVYEFQKKISAELKLRYIPKLKFIFDEGVYKAIHVDKIISELEKKDK